MIRLFIVAIFVPFSSNAIAESVVVKYRGEVDLARFNARLLIEAAS